MGEMREILFRAKDCIHQQWFYGWYFYTPEFTWSQHNIISAKDWMNVKTVNPETVGQYTGLTDKNGTKIFEGDICWFYGGEYYSGSWEHNAIVAITDITDDEQIHYLKNAEYCEIIGNVFDNPELLEGDKT